MTTAVLGDVADFINGFAFKPDDWGEEGLPIVRIQNLTDRAKPINRTTRAVADKFHVRRGELLVSWSATLGVFTWDRTDEALVNQHIFRVVPKPGVNQRFLRHMLSSALTSMERHLHGATMKHVNRGEFLATRLPLPSLDEQRRIATILDHADAIRTKRRQVLTHLDTLTQSIFHDMFGDPDDAKETVSFGEVSGLSGGRNLVAEDSTADTPYRVLKISAVTSGRFKAHESKPLPPDYVPPASHLVRPGDLLMSRANTTELVGAVAYVGETPPNLALPDKVWRFDWKSEGSEPAFYHALLGTPSIRRRISKLSSGTGGSMKNVSKAKLESMPLPAVAVREQQDFVERAAGVGVQREAVQRALVADDELFASLQSRAFRGEL